jgi:hypothetical protein
LIALIWKTMIHITSLFHNIKYQMVSMLNPMPHLLTFKHFYHLALLFLSKAIKVWLEKLLIFIFGILILQFFLRKARSLCLTLNIIQTQKVNLKILYLELAMQMLLIKSLKYFILEILQKFSKKRKIIWKYLI